MYRERYYIANRSKALLQRQNDYKLEKDATRKRRTKYNLLNANEIQSAVRIKYQSNHETKKKIKQRHAYDKNPEPKKMKMRYAYGMNPEPKKMQVRHAYGMNPEPKKMQLRHAYSMNPEPKKMQVRRAYGKNPELKKIQM